MNRMITMFVVAAAWTLVPGLSYAADSMKTGKGPCAPDIQKFCKDVQPGHGNIMRCLKEHKDDLSVACKAKGKMMRGEAKETHAACKGDVQKFCKDVQPGKGNIMRCLKTHEDDLSIACKTEREKMKEMMSSKG